jgi:hypothetical protein
MFRRCLVAATASSAFLIWFLMPFRNFSGFDFDQIPQRVQISARFCWAQLWPKPKSPLSLRNIPAHVQPPVTRWSHACSSGTIVLCKPLCALSVSMQELSPHDLRLTDPAFSELSTRSLAWSPNRRIGATGRVPPFDPNFSQIQRRERHSKKFSVTLNLCRLTPRIFAMLSMQSPRTLCDMRLRLGTLKLFWITSGSNGKLFTHIRRDVAAYWRQFAGCPRSCS